MSDAWPTIKITEFEQVITRPATSLLRVRGKGSRRREAGQRPFLIIDDGQRQQRFSPLSAPPDESRMLRAAYAVPTVMVQDARAFWLEHESGGRTNLPIPERGVARAGGEGATAEPDPELVREAQRAQESRLVQMQDAHAVELESARRKTSELEEAHAAEHESARRQASEAQARAEEALLRAAGAENRERTIGQQLAQAAARGESLTQRVTELEQTVQTLTLQLADRERELAQAQGALRPVQRELSEQRSARAGLERELDSARDKARMMTIERDELARQASAYDGIAVKARERAMHAEDAHQKAAAALEELQVWRGELERRLAATTSELGAARAAREADERELGRLRAALGEGPSVSGDASGAGTGVEAGG